MTNSSDQSDRPREDNGQSWQRRQLSLLPEYEGSSNGGGGDESDASSEGGGSRRWITAFGIFLLLILGYGGWRWWRSASQAPSQRGPRAVPVELEAVDTATVAATSTFTGTLEAERSVGIQAKQPGQVVQIFVDQGQPVQAGTPILRLSAEQEQADVAAATARIEVAQAARSSAASELESLRAERERLQAEIQLQQEQFRRTNELVSAGALPQEELDLKQRDLRVAQANLNSLDRRIQAARDQLQQAEATLRERRAGLERLQADLEDTTVRAPFAGTLGDVPVELGDYVQLGQDLAQLVDNDTMNLNLNVPQERSQDLRLGLPVEIVNSSGDVQKQGQIDFIAPQVDSQSRFIQTEAIFPNPNRRLQDGQFVRTRVVWQQRSNRIVVPQTAVVYQGERRFVYVPQQQEGQMVASRQSVQLGLEQGSDVEITAGLQSGQRIVVSGIQKIGDGVPIQPLDETQASGEER